MNSRGGKQASATQQPLLMYLVLSRAEVELLWYAGSDAARLRMMQARVLPTHVLLAGCAMRARWPVCAQLLLHAST